jgi:hypothetical protein
VSEFDIVKHYDHVSAFPTKPTPIPAPVVPSSDGAGMDADESPLSSASPTHPPRKHLRPLSGPFTNVLSRSSTLK